MEHNRAYFEQLVVKLQYGTITDDELNELITWYNDFNDEPYEVPESYAVSLAHLKSRLLGEFEDRINREDPGRKTFSFYRGRYLWIAAASFLLVVSAGLYVFISKQQPSGVGNTIANTISIEPGGDKAILTLADGRKVNLTDTHNDTTFNEQGILIQKTKDGELSYAKTPTPPAGGGVASGRLSFNTLETPRGGQFQLRLPDGTRVWLNAASSIRYPQVFAGNERIVFLDGEAYFEVAADNLRPFKVHAGQQLIEVIGTAFNVNNYSDEAQEMTTLESGAIRVHAAGSTQVLKPGQCALTSTPGQINVQQADLETTLAWKEGRLDFKEADIATIMRQVSRWYNVDVVYPKGIPEGAVTGGISRQSNLSSLLKILEFSRIHFKLEDHAGKKTLVVLP